MPAFVRVLVVIFAAGFISTASSTVVPRPPAHPLPAVPGPDAAQPASTQTPAKPYFGPAMLAVSEPLSVAAAAG